MSRLTGKQVVFGLRLARARLRGADDPLRQLPDRHVRSLRCPAQKVECLLCAAALLSHQYAFGLLDDRHGGELGTQAGKRRDGEKPGLAGPPGLAQLFFQALGPRAEDLCRVPGTLSA